MKTESVCLNLIAARRLRDELFDYLREQNDLVTGFTASAAVGHGPNAQLHTTEEQVKGYADQILVRIILESADAQRLLDRLAAEFAGTEMVYWIAPVMEFGLIGERKP
jgi:hypothetical protein